VFALGVLACADSSAQQTRLRAAEDIAGSPNVSFGNLPALQASTPVPNSPHVPGDFDGDGTSDLLWFNPTSSQVGYWTITASTVHKPHESAAGTVMRTGIRTINVTPGYFVGASSDFNDDGYVDLIFTSASRDLWLWTNNHNGGFTSTEIGTYPSQWQLVGAGDIDGDGYDDLLWLDPSECQFAYWTMHGGVRTGYKIIPIACGYYPMNIGYYSPSNRLSIMWTSAAHDLFIWDSTPNGFKSYDLSNLGNTGFGYLLDIKHIWAIGGGFMGKGIGVEWFESIEESNPGSNVPGGIGYGFTLSRNFDADGNQTGYEESLIWSGGVGDIPGSGGYLVQGLNTNATGLYMLDGTNSGITTSGLPVDDLSYSGNAPEVALGPLNDKWLYPVGWFVVGAPGNGIAAVSVP
jgi:hypothetical protein